MIFIYTQNRIPNCPKCGSKMREGAWDYIDKLPGGSYRLQVVYPAWVCSNSCGYYEELYTDRIETIIDYKEKW